ncbi:MAG: hypothetical protein ACE5GX_05300 [Thermoanaerobaculia bacterium]
MKRGLICALALVFLVPAVRAADNGWPAELGDVQRMVRASVGDVPYTRVKVQRGDGVIDVSIRLKNLPRQFRTMTRDRAGDEQVFLATNIVELFTPDLEIVSYDLSPLDFIDYYFGFGVFNFGKKIKREAIIEVRGANGQEFKNKKKKYKLRKNSVQLRFVERGLGAGSGLYLLFTQVGPWELLTYFCASCIS